MNWAIVGFGWVARDYMAPAIAAAGHKLTAVTDPSPQARAAAEQTGATAYPHLDALLARNDVDAIYIATPNHLHRAPAEAALAAGRPTLLEKPMAATLADAEAIAATALRTGTLYGTAFDQRWHPLHRAMAERIAAGAIGTPTAIRIVYACWLGPNWHPHNWRADPHAAGGGAVIDLAPHGLDLAHLLLGEPVTELHIRLQRRVHAYAVEDGGILSGATASGVLFSAHVAYNTPEALPRRCLEIIGTEGALIAENSMGQTPGGTLARLCGRTGTCDPITAPATSPFTAQAQAFARAVAGHPHRFCATRDLALTRLLFQAYQAAL